MAETHLLTREHFPVVYKDGEATAVLVDVTTFAQIEVILDNLLNREEEPEDAIIAASQILERLLSQGRQETPSPDWEQELDEL